MPTTIEGTVTRDGRPLERAYVQLRDAAGEFTGERRTDSDGGYRFHIAPGRWIIAVLAAGGVRAEEHVEVGDGDAARLDIAVNPTA